jgi:hypothetical protein
MKAIIKYLLNTIGLSLMFFGFTCDCPETVSKLLYCFGFMVYCSVCYWSGEDEAKQEKQIERLEKKVEELENRSRKEYIKPELSVENVPSNYEEYLKSKDRW